MKSLFKVAGIILAAIFAVSMFASASASAAWEQCGTEKASTAASKYTEHQCTTASGSGGWAWQVAPLSEAARVKGSLALADVKEGITVECYGVGEGTLAKVEIVTVLNCRTIKGCEAGTVEAEARDTPWKTEQYDTEGKSYEALKEEGTNGKPGWAVKCKILKVADTDTCTAEGTESLLLANKATGAELLVLATFQHLVKAKCTLGGAGSGEVTGSVAVLKTNGWGLRVT